MAELAFQSEELDLEEHQRAGARLLYAQQQAGEWRPVTSGGLIELIRKHGPKPGYLESALLLTVEEYRRVEEVYKDEQRPASRRRRK